MAAGALSFVLIVKNKVIIQSIFLKNFRSYQEREFSFSPRVNLILGPNAAGKTNLLEAIYLLFSGESFRAGKIEEMIKDKTTVAHIQGKVRKDGTKEDLKVVLSRGEINGHLVPRRQFLIDETKRSKRNFIGHFLAVIFRPEDLDIVIGSPSLRRRFLDEVLMGVDNEYYRSLLSYQKGLRARNRVLESIREGKTTIQSLFFWDRLLIKNGELITQKREALIEFLNGNKATGSSLKINYLKNIISPQRLAEKQKAEIGAGMSLVGPHRDDFVILKNGWSLFSYGSRGEQRLGVFWLKMGQLSFWQEKTKEKPVLLLDDIFSELDESHQEAVFAVLQAGQVIIAATAKPSFLDSKTEVIKI